MRSCLLLVLATLALMFPGVTRGSSTPPLDLNQLNETSHVIVLGQVIRVQTQGEVDRVRVRVIDLIKGVSERREFLLDLTPRGLMGFDRMLSKGDAGVFFLASLPPTEERSAVLAHPQSIALLRTGTFVAVD